MANTWYIEYTYVRRCPSLVGENVDHIRLIDVLASQINQSLQTTSATNFAKRPAALSFTPLHPATRR